MDHRIGIYLKRAYKGGCIVVSFDKDLALRDVLPGDLLLAINDIAAADLGTNDISNLIKSLGRPLTISFYRVKLPKDIEELLTCPLRMDKGFKKSSIYAANETLIKLYLTLKQINGIKLNDEDVPTVFNHFDLPPTSLNAVERDVTGILQQYLDSEEGAVVMGYFGILFLLSSTDTDDVLTLYYLYEKPNVSARVEALKATTIRVTALSTNSHGPRSVASILSSDDPELSLALYLYHQLKAEKVRKGGGASAMRLNPLGGTMVTKANVKESIRILPLRSLLSPSSSKEVRKLVELCAEHPSAGRLEYVLRQVRARRCLSVNRTEKGENNSHTNTTSSASVPSICNTSNCAPEFTLSGGRALGGCTHIAVHRPPFCETSRCIGHNLPQKYYDSENTLRTNESILEVASNPFSWLSF